MVNELNERLTKIAEHTVSTLDKTYENVQKLESANASRMVWLVGISGFAILNLPNIFNPTNQPTVWDFLPWLVTAFCGVIAHWSHRSIDIQNFAVYIEKRESLLNFIVSGSENVVFQDLHDILTNKTERLVEISNEHEKAVARATRLEQLTFIFFLVSLVSFVWKFVIQYI